MRRLARRSVLLGTLGLAGCGFEPVYMPSAGDTPGVAQRELAAIDVAIIPDRPGQLLRQALQQRLGGADPVGPAIYPERGLLDRGRGHRHPAQIQRPTFACSATRTGRLWRMTQRVSDHLGVFPGAGFGEHLPECDFGAELDTEKT